MGHVMDNTGNISFWNSYYI